MRFRQACRNAALLAAVAVTLTTGTALATEIGTIETLEGRIEVLRGERRVAASVGMPVRTGDVLRAAPGGRARLLLIDDTVVSVSPGTEVRLDELVPHADGAGYSGGLGLVSGEVRMVSGRGPSDELSSFEIRTPTAKAHVGDSHSLVSYIMDTATTEIVTFSGAVEVYALRDLENEGVVVRAGERVYVTTDKPMADPRPLARREFGQFLEGVDLWVSLGSGFATQGVLLAPPLSLAPPVRATPRSSSQDAGDLLDGAPVVDNAASIGFVFE